MNDQKKLWNDVHDKGDIGNYSSTPTELAKEVLEIIPSSSKILELGCGAGNDSVGFANGGHIVVATDFSENAISRNSKRLEDISNATFEALDISKPFEFKDGSFDVVYARLSLHYFHDENTRKIFKEIHRILKPNGPLYFICKSTKDPLYGKGEKIEKDMYELNGHVRHFFSEEYSRELLSDHFIINKLESGEERFYESDSSYIKVFARALK